MSNADVKPQPAPEPKGPEVYPVALALLERYGEFSNVSTLDLRRLMEQQREIGLAKYGQPLHRDDGRDAVRDATDEVADLFVYMVRLWMQGNGAALHRVLGLVAQVYSCACVEMTSRPWEGGEE